MSSNSSLLNLTDIVTRTCDTTQLPTLALTLEDDVPTAWIPMTNDSYGAMSEICSPNPVNLYGKCVLWCILPLEYMNAYNASGSDNFGTYFFRQLRETGANMTGNWIYSAKQNNSAGKENGAAAVGRPLSITTIGTLALGLCVAMSI